ncbi:MAG TPA: DUF2200 domain-containing protein [Croceibacterium sp.]|jgi:hypothetical protein
MNIHTLKFTKVYPFLVAKAERKGRTKEEVDEVTCWLTGYDRPGLDDQIARETDYETFFAEAPRMNPAAPLIKGTICGYRIEDIEDPVERQVRMLDKLVDELAKGKAIEKIKRG